MISSVHLVRRRWLAVALVVVASGWLVIAPPAQASGRGRGPRNHTAYYLALGDSVPFGYREPTSIPTPVYTDPANFVGYPEDMGAELKVRVVNASCPGETSASLIDDTQPSYACETPTGYRTNFPLHVSYRDSQLDYAVHFLARHRDTRLVSLMIGANDGFLCQATTADHCASELPAVLAKVNANVTTIMSRLREAARYRGQIVIVNYYSTDYASATAVAQTQALNQAVDSAAKPFHVAVADGYGTFQRAAVQAGGDTCAAGLLTVLSTGGCGVHPSIAGQELLAGAVERVVHLR